MSVKLMLGDSLERLKELPDNSVDSVVCDPPYGLSKEPDIAEVMQHWINGDKYEHKSNGFMGKSWDSFVPGPEYWREVYRVMKPGAHALVFAGTRTWDLMSCALRFAGFENRDTIASFGGPPGLAWTFGSGFPKSHNVSKALDRLAGAEREVVGTMKAKLPTSNGKFATDEWSIEAGKFRDINITAPATDAAKQWDGWGSALKPAWEVVLVFRKPLGESTLAKNILKHGTGAINIDASRINFDAAKEGAGIRAFSKGSGLQTAENVGGEFLSAANTKAKQNSLAKDSLERTQSQGRWPANVLFDEEAAAVLDEQSGVCKSGGSQHERSLAQAECYGEYTSGRNASRAPDSGGASRFFYVAKASKRERNAGLEGMPEREKSIYSGGIPSAVNSDPRGMSGGGSRPAANHHPTVKPIKLMEYLVRMITPPGGCVLDPFLGSGSTLVAAQRLGFNGIGIEMNSEYLEIAKKRIAHEKKKAKPKQLELQDAGA